MKIFLRLSWQQFTKIVLFFLLLLRLLSMLLIPLTDTTEARYAEIARKMLETGNWVTLLHDYHVPFWAKPPLSTWLSAASMGVFGINEFAVRLPALLLAFLTLWLTAAVMRQHSGRDASLATILILSSGLLFLAAAGTVMTDPALLFCVTLSQVAFWRALTQQSRYWPYLFFVGLGLGLLAKGPLAIVLVGMPIFCWVLLRKQWRQLWYRLPWIYGTILLLAIALPWYYWAEYRTPGFLRYYIMGEHIARFLDSGWHGDKYGFAHATPRGMIWLYALGAILPWSIAMLPWLGRHGRVLSKLCQDNDGWLLYLALWTSMTLLFFSLSGNIIFPYALPMLPGCALLFAELWQRARHQPSGNSLPWIASLSGMLLGIFLLINTYNSSAYLRTQKTVIAGWHAQHPAADSVLIYWHDRREFSAEFYSQGRVKTTLNPQQLTRWLADGKAQFVVTDTKHESSLPSAIRQHLTTIQSYQVMQQTMLLLHYRPLAITQPALGEIKSHD
ncbi:glycosyltransferase family 39 protein [Neisseriaceae bacterium TC5R-5]|nr:glycosyltransferase family 39 protein [Neisseriaceae bacterium TC5R-5]